MIDRCFSTMLKVGKSKGIGYIKYRSRKKNPINSFFFVKQGVRKLPNNHLWIPCMHSIKLREKEYLTDQDIKNVTSGRIYYKRNSDRWYVVLRIMIDDPMPPKEFNNFSIPIGIDLGIKNLATIAFGGFPDKDSPLLFNGESNPLLSGKIKYAHDQMARISSIIDRKANWNLYAMGFNPSTPKKKIPKKALAKAYSSNSIKKLRRKSLKYTEYAANARLDILKKFCSALARSKPGFISVEELDTYDMRTSERSSTSLHRNIERSSFGFIRVFLKWKCTQNSIIFIEVPKYFPSTQRCSRCGHIRIGRERLRPSTRNYHCKECDLRIDRDINAARNLLQFGYDIISGKTGYSPRLRGED